MILLDRRDAKLKFYLISKVSKPDLSGVDPFIELPRICRSPCVSRRIDQEVGAPEATEMETKLQHVLQQIAQAKHHVCFLQPRHYRETMLEKCYGFQVTKPSVTRDGGFDARQTRTACSLSDST